ncbi:helix-turn-helix domain-containing protein [Vagococcus acidifermentans]|uniref:helix-turn-helix domain-containing protein n=1 Tax=Vagococcus acidifermentans TaxID=564710 RepID=UPI001476D473|nr:helix-turn-helix domain-containing protein [Vagococcus acidifermentans]
MDTIGEKLKIARLEKGLTIGDLQKITKIQRRFLEAIEADDFDAMPSDYYTRTFIKLMAEAVDLDARPLLRQFDGEPDQQFGYTPRPERIEGSRKARHEESRSKVAIFKSYIPVLILILTVSLIIGGIIFATVMENKSEPMIKQQPTVSSVSSEDKSKDTTEEDSSSSEEKPETDMKIVFDRENNGFTYFDVKRAERPLTVSFEGLTAPCWVGLAETPQSAIFYQYTVKPGEVVETTIPEELDTVQITLGASSYVKMKINNEDFDFNPNNTASEKRVIVLNLAASDD